MHPAVKITRSPVPRQDSQSPTCAASLQAALERLLQQLVAVQNEWLRANGGFGEPFKLQQHLLPPAPSKAAQQPNGSAPVPMDRC